MTAKKANINDLEESHKDDKQVNLYQYAQEELKPIEYSKRAKPLYNFLNGFRLTYHFVSVLLGVATCLLISLLFVGDIQSSTIAKPLLVGMSVLIGGVLLLLLVGVEMGKATAAKNIFKAKANRKNISVLQVASFTFLVLVSIALSAVGGALLSYKIGDKSSAIATTAKTQRAKINGKHAQRIAQLSEVIAALEKLSVDKKARKWGLTEAEQNNLKDAKAEKATLEAATERKLKSIEQSTNAQLNENKSSTNITMLVAMVLVTLLEIIAVFAYYFKYAYLSKTAKEGVKLGKISEQTEQPQEPTLEQQLTNKIIDLLERQQRQYTPAPLPTQPTPAPANVQKEQKQNVEQVEEQRQAPAAKTEVAGLKRYDAEKQKKPQPRKASARGKSKRIDHEKLNDLLASGVSTKIAAATVGCSERTARTAKSKMEK
ncbi:MAG: hypothetical protein AAF599_00105 [Bacteroidota bacterium]